MDKGGVEKKKERVFIVDGNSVLYRSYYALPALSTSRGFPTNAIYGFHNIIRKLIKEEKPRYLAVAFDVKGPTVRHKKYEAYKAQRKPMPDDLSVQIPKVKQLLEALNIPYFEMQEYEADDVMATIAEKLRKQGIETVIVSGDKDLLQVLKPGILIYHPGKEIYIDHKSCEEVFGVKPEQVPDVLALQGDPVDNIPGVKGIGEKTAKSLIKQYGNLDNLLAHLHELKPKIRQAIERDMENLKLSRELTKIKSDLPIEVDIEKFRIKEPNLDKLIPLLRELEFHSLLKEYMPEEKEVEAEYRIVKDIKELEEVVERVKKQGFFSFDTETDHPNPNHANLVGISIATSAGRAYYIPLGHRYMGAENLSKDEVFKRLGPLLGDRGIKKWGHNLKYDIIVLKWQGLKVDGIDRDSMLLSYLLNPGRRQHNLDDIALEQLGYKKTPYSEIASKGRKSLTLDMVDMEKVGRYSCEDADIALRLCELLYPRIVDEGLEKLYREIELPLIEVLADMEMAGVKVDAEKLHRFSQELAESLHKIEERIFKIIGFRFNLNSPKQLAEVLYEKLNLPVIKKTKKTKGYSTDTEVLQELANYHEVPALVLEYRQLAKLKSTYVDALPQLINPRTGRIHTSYNQTVTATGRLSSSDPNLQNIPVRGDLGKRIREAFIAEDGYLLVSADYSQIELRVLAHLSKDPNLIEAFRRGEDIHTKTANEVFGSLDIPPDEKRRKAKIINFSIIYGTSAYSLSKELGVSTHEAKEFIERYFQKYPKVREFLDKTIEEARSRGYVTTLFGRKRYIPELLNPNKNIQAAGERIAVNTPIQGTAADLMKKAMIEVWREIQKQGFDAKMIIQVHDELVFEVKEEQADQLMKMVKERMEGVMKLEVPLVVDIACGKNWAEAKG